MRVVMDKSAETIIIANDQLPLVTDIGHGRPGPGWIHPTRVMDCHDFLYIVNGTFVVREEETKYVLKAGDTLILKAGVPHYGELGNSDDVEWFFIHFELRDMSPAPYVLNEPIKTLQSSREDTDGFITLPKKVHIPKEMHSAFISQLELLYKTYWFKDDYKAVSLNLNTMELFLDLAKIKKQGDTSNNSNHIINRIEQFLLSSVNRTFSARELAEHVDMNYNYVSTLFKKIVGLSPQQYHTQVRIQRAATMLRNHEGTINEISTYLGFENVYHFSNVFKKVMGVSPRNYINKMCL